MKRVLAAVTAGALSLSGAALIGVSVASADSTTTTTTTLAPPVQGTNPVPVYMQVDTVTAGGGTGVLKPAVGCAQTNEFLVGQTVVFRMSAVNVAAGGVPLTGANTKSVTITIPGEAPLAMDYGNHGTTAFWSAGWHTTATTPIGVVNFTLERTGPLVAESDATAVLDGSRPALDSVVRSLTVGVMVSGQVIDGVKLVLPAVVVKIAEPPLRYGTGDWTTLR